MPKVLEAINGDTRNTVFSYIPNTAETSFFGMIETAEAFINKKKTSAILKGQRSISAEKVTWETVLSRQEDLQHRIL